MMLFELGNMRKFEGEYERLFHDQVCLLHNLFMIHVCRKCETFKLMKYSSQTSSREKN